MSPPKPKHLQPQYGAQFADESIVAAYRFRPPYPDEVFDTLDELLGERPRVVLDAGCGSGDLAIPLADIVERVDAVDPSAAMLAAARSRPGADSPRLRWIHASLEDVKLSPPYGLILAGESLHWMDWPVVLPRMSDALAPGACLAIVGRTEGANPWWPELLQIINVYSTNRDYQPYDLIQELQGRELFRVVGRRRTSVVAVGQTVADYIESIHSRNGFSRDRMTAQAARDFDTAAAGLLAGYARDGQLNFEVVGSVVWGEPSPNG